MARKREVCLLIFVFWVPVVIAVGCRSARQSRPAIVNDDLDLMRSKVLDLVAIGTSAEKAKRIMIEQGFECPFDDGEDATSSTLVCRYEEADGIWVTYTWQAAFTCERGLVTNVKCSFWGTGP